MKKIFVDGLGIVESHFSGVGQYILGILRGMDSLIAQEIAQGKKPRKVIVMLPNDAVAKFNSFNFQHITYKKFPMTTGKMLAQWHHNLLPPMDLWYGRGIYLFPRFVSMRLAFSKSILVIYDLSFELHKDFVEDNNARFLSGAVQRSVRNVNKIITISQNSKKEIIDFYNVSSAVVSVATPGVDRAYLHRRNQAEIDKAKRKYGVKGAYILALSNLEPRKNLDSLVEAYGQLKAADAKRYSLLIVGADGWKADKLFEKMHEKNDSKGYTVLRPTSYVTDEDKPALISGATVLVYPSHYEGFGMPPIEALACGVPVITSNNSSLPEAVGTAGLTVNSHSLKQLQQALETTLHSIETVTKKARIEGPKQAAKFSWEESAQKYFDAADELE